MSRSRGKRDNPGVFAMSMLALVTVLWLTPAQAEEPCKSCWNASCAELKDLGVPACAKAPAKPRAKAPSSCAAGKVQSADTQGHCCWPGQAWSTAKGRCVGEPECPGGFRVDGNECVAAVQCPANTSWNGTSCAAKVSCPANTSWNGTSCVAQVSCPAGTSWTGAACAPSAPSGSGGGGTAAGSTKAEPKTGAVWVWMPDGRFHQGCEPQDTQCESDEKPGEDKSMEGFWMMQTEVTVAAYQACVRAGACENLDAVDTSMKTCNAKNGRNEHPMNCVDWNAATAFCRWMGGRLPTAAEWEYAAKSGSSRIYPWGDEASTGRRANFCDANCPNALNEASKKKWVDNGWVSFGEDDGWAGTAPVGSFSRGDTPWGLKDMAGNVWEWTASSYDSSNKEKRGGGWYDIAPSLRAGNRNRIVPADSDGYLGFRCAQ